MSILQPDLAVRRAILRVGGFSFDSGKRLTGNSGKMANEKSETEPKPVSACGSEQALSDHQLMEAVAHGHEEAFAEILSRYRDRITNFIFRFLNNREDAMDLAQETFVRLYFAAGRYHRGYAFSTYLYRIAANLAISEIRRRKRQRIFSLNGFFASDDDEKDLDPPDNADLPDRQLEADFRSRAIGRAIASLPEKYRLPIVLRDVEGLAYEEVAEILGLGLGTTKSRISRGRAMLRVKLEAAGIGDI